MATKKSEKIKPDFDPKKFLATIGEGRKVVLFLKKQTIFAQGECRECGVLHPGG